MKYLLALLIAVTCAQATSYTVYSGDTINYGRDNFTFSLSTGLASNLGDALELYEKATANNASKTKVYALSEVRNALIAAKADDKLYVRTKAGSYDVPYKGCEEFDIYKVCFTGVTYYEEDGAPLGDGTLDTVKEGPNGYLLPFTVTIESSADKLTTKRTFTPTTPYIGEEVLVLVEIKNTATTPAPRFTYTEVTPLPTQDPLTLSLASLAKDATATLEYTIHPQIAGVYTFTNTGLKEMNSTLFVKDPLNTTGAPKATYTNEPVPFSLALKNQYADDLDVTVTLTADAQLNESRIGRGKITAPNTVVYPKQTLKKDKTTTINGSVIPQTPGEHTITLQAAYTTDKERTHTATFTYTVLARGFTILPQNGALLLNNTLETFVENLTVTCANTTHALGPAHPESAFSVKFIIPADANCTAHYTVQGVEGTQSFNQHGIVMPAQLTPQQEPQVTPTQETPPAAQPTQTPPVVVTQGTQEEGDKKGVIQRFLAWLDGLFS